MHKGLIVVANIVQFSYENQVFLGPKCKKNRCKPARRERAAAAGLRALEGFGAERLWGPPGWDPKEVGSLKRDGGGNWLEIIL